MLISPKSGNFYFRLPSSTLPSTLTYGPYFLAVKSAHAHPNVQTLGEREGSLTDRWMTLFCGGKSRLCLTLTPNNTETIERMTLSLFCGQSGETLRAAPTQMDLVQYINRLYANIIKRQSDEQVNKIIYYNIARLLALYKSYWAAMNKIFIYARPCVIRWRAQLCFSSLFLSTQKLTAMIKNFLDFFWNLASF